MSGSQKPNLALYVRASGIVKDRIGACLFCHEFWMELFALYELGKIDLEVLVVPPNSEALKKLESGQLPMLFDKALGSYYVDNQDLERHIFDIAREANVYLFAKDKEVEHKIEGLYKNFKLFMHQKVAFSKANPGKVPDADSKVRVAERRLIQHLSQLNQLLGKRSTRYLVHDQMIEYDCELLPRLHHIRLAGERLGDFQIPQNLIHLWQYILTGYRTAAFQVSCPADQDILHHYRQQFGITDSKSLRDSIAKPTKSFSVPSAVLQMMESQDPGYKSFADSHIKS